MPQIQHYGTLVNVPEGIAIGCAQLDPDKTFFSVKELERNVQEAVRKRMRAYVNDKKKKKARVIYVDDNGDHESEDHDVDEYTCCFDMMDIRILDVSLVTCLFLLVQLLCSCTANAGKCRP